MKDAKSCPKEFRRIKGICAGKPNKNGGREVLLGFEVDLKEHFEEWNYVAKDRLIDHFNRQHASDLTDGNVDFDLRASTWRGNKLYGSITLKVPKSYFDDWEDEDYFISVGKAAMDDTINLDLSRYEQEVLGRYKVTAEVD